MTNTLYQNIQALGNRMASNLETMGVSASFSDGGLTLADKILQIQHFTNGLLLSADESVDQSSNTVKLTALLIENGETVSGATVLLFSDWINQTYSSNTTINQSIGNEWTIDVGDTGSIFICANGSTIDGGDAILSLSKGSLIVLKNGTSQDVRSHSSSVYSYKDGVVYYGNSSVDISSYGVDVTNLYKASGAVKVTYGVPLTTDSNGVATYDYTCTGVGKKEFYAKSGSVVSVPCSVWDTFWYDIATEGKKSTAWSNPDGITIATTDEGTTLSEVANYYSSTNTMTGDFRLEFELKTTGGAGRFGVYTSNLSKSSHVNITENDWVHFRITRQNGVVTLERSTDGVTWIIGTWGSDTLTTETCGFKFYNLATNRTISYRNMKCYAI